MKDRAEEISEQLRLLLARIGELESSQAAYLAELDERKKAEVALRRTNRALTALSQCNRAMMRASAEADLLQEICRVIVDVAGYRMAWVGLADDDALKSVRPVAQAGFDEGYLETARITWADTERGRGPVGTAVRTGKPTVANCSDPEFAPWREEAVRRGYGTCIGLPLESDSGVFGVLAIYGPEPNAFDAAEVELLVDLADNLAYGIQSLRNRAARQRAEKALVESTARLKAVLHSLSEVVFILDDEGRYLDVLTSESELLRAAADQLLGRRVDEVMPADVAAIVHQAIAAAVQSGRTQIVEYSLDVLAGWRWFEGRATRIVDYAEAKPRVVWAAHDITERKTAADRLRRSHEELEQRVRERTAELAEINERLRTEVGERTRAEAAIKASEQRYHMLFENSPIALWVIDYTAVMSCLDRLRDRGTSSFQTYFRQRPEEVVSCIALSRVLDVNQATVRLVEAENKEQVIAAVERSFTPAGFDVFREAIAAVAEGKHYFEAETVHRTVKGNLIDVFLCLSIVPGYEPGQTLALVSFMDITARKRAEEALRRSEGRFRSYFEQGLIGMAITAPDKGALEVNDRLCEMLGYTCDELLHRNWETYTHPDDLEPNVALFRRVLAGEIDGYYLDKRFIRKDGRIIHGSLSTKCVRNLDGSVAYFVTLVQDITQRKIAEEALLREQRRLGQLLDVYEQHRKLVAYEIHDAVAQPLAAARMNLEGSLWQLSAECDPSARKGFEASSRLLQQTIDHARRLMSGLRPPVLDESGLIDAIDFLVCESHGEIDVRFEHEVHFQRLAPPLETAVFRVVQESLTNALRHSRSDRIRISLRHIDDRLRIEVEDWGVGFDPEGVEQDRFGLEGIRERAQLFGGVAAIDSEPGGGTRIAVELPIVEAQSDEND
jgi:PAS domain S-box-containing protein